MGIINCESYKMCKQKVYLTSLNYNLTFAKHALRRTNVIHLSKMLTDLKIQILKFDHSFV